MIDFLVVTIAFGILATNILAQYQPGVIPFDSSIQY